MEGGSAMNSNSGGGSFGAGGSCSFWTDLRSSDCRCLTASDLATAAAVGAAGVVAAGADGAEKEISD
jgi:hypothetical protein